MRICVVIPTKLQECILTKLHKAHLAKSSCKLRWTVSRPYVFLLVDAHSKWPEIYVLRLLKFLSVFLMVYIIN